MKLFPRKRDAELWPDAELWALFPDRSIRVDKNPKIRGRLIVSDKLQLVARLTPPLQVCVHKRGREPGAQPVPTGEHVWVLTGREDEIPSDEEFQEGLEEIFHRSMIDAMKSARRKRALTWWVSFGMLVAAMLTAWAKFGNLIDGWWW